MENLISLWASSGLAQMQSGQLIMMLVGLGLLFLAISKGFEPLLLVPIGFGTILANIPGAGFDAAPVYDALGHLESPGGLLYYIYHAGIETGLFPLVIFMGVGAMTDFGPLLANPKTLLLGAAAQVGIFTTILGAVALSHFRILDFSIREAASIGIIGGADGLSDGIKKKANQMWSLSKMTLPHGLVRVMVVEQIYRAWSITQNHPYHRE